MHVASFIGRRALRARGVVSRRAGAGRNQAKQCGPERSAYPSGPPRQPSLGPSADPTDAGREGCGSRRGTPERGARNRPLPPGHALEKPNGTPVPASTISTRSPPTITTSVGVRLVGVPTTNVVDEASVAGRRASCVRGVVRADLPRRPERLRQPLALQVAGPRRAGRRGPHRCASRCLPAWVQLLACVGLGSQGARSG